MKIQACAALFLAATAAAQTFSGSAALDEAVDAAERLVNDITNACPVVCMIRKIWSALMMPSPVVVKSRKMM